MLLLRRDLAWRRSDVELVEHHYLAARRIRKLDVFNHNLTLKTLHIAHQVGHHAGYVVWLLNIPIAWPLRVHFVHFDVLSTRDNVSLRSFSRYEYGVGVERIVWLDPYDGMLENLPIMMELYRLTLRDSEKPIWIDAPSITCLAPNHTMSDKAAKGKRHPLALRVRLGDRRGV